MCSVASRRRKFTSRLNHKGTQSGPHIRICMVMHTNTHTHTHARTDIYVHSHAHTWDNNFWSHLNLHARLYSTPLVVGVTKASLRSSNDCLALSGLDFSRNITYNIQFYELVRSQRYLTHLVPAKQIVKEFNSRVIQVWPPTRERRAKKPVSGAEPDSDDDLEDPT